jgi:uncharacterized membrane protein YdbT with pleckstrin-like domain
LWIIWWWVAVVAVVVAWAAAAVLAVWCMQRAFNFRRERIHGQSVLVERLLVTTSQETQEANRLFQIPRLET